MDNLNADPDILVDNPAAITRVAPSFLRVSQLELFARRARSHAHDNAGKRAAARSAEQTKEVEDTPQLFFMILHKNREIKLGFTSKENTF